MWLWALLPICLAIFGTAGIWTVFAISVSNGSVNLTEGFPYISECGSYNPQSCLFAQICNIFSILALWVVVIRFQQVRDYGCHGKANIISIILGFTSCFGVSVLGNFQQTVLRSVHLLGAFLAFFLGLGYFWMQLFLTYRAQPLKDRHWVGPVRVTICILCTVLVIVSILYMNMQTEQLPYILNIVQWLLRELTVLVQTDRPSPAAVCEWALVMFFFCLFGLFAAEFRHIDCHNLTVQSQTLMNDSGPSVIETNSHVTYTPS
uniref:Zgc:123244 n=1 Tax=Sphaeramia orbicularis TaxID=375764 RepID=A0A672YBM0_9TELE